MITAVIPAYKNREQLMSNLSRNLPFMAQCEIVLVNDDPSSSLKGSLPEGDIILVENGKNLGFAGAVDEGIKRADNRYIMLLNSDVLLLDTSYLLALAKIRSDNSLFAVSFAQKEKDGSVVGKNSFHWQDGFFRHKKAEDLKEGINGWAEGGACILDKKKYNEIGGFDRLFSPYYWEDIDLSYRAWKSGYKIVFDPGVKVEHHHESTIKKYFSESSVKRIAYRNQFIFIWKNIRDKKLLLAHVVKILSLLPVMILRDHDFGAGLWNALMKLPAILKKNHRYPVGDRQILTKF